MNTHLKQPWLPGLFFALLLVNFSCAQPSTFPTVNGHGSAGNPYLVVEPKGPIKGALILLAGFGQREDEIFPETRLEEVAYEHNILTVAFAAGNKLYADSITQANLSAVIRDVINRYKVDPKHFVLGGFSAGGMIVLRYVELCNQFPDRFPIHPAGVFMVDSPIDIFSTWDNLEEIAKNNYSEPAVEEAERAMSHIRAEFGVPREHRQVFSELTAFSMDKRYGEPEKFLQQTAVRAYHDVDIAWRLVNRNQTVHNSNYEMTAELINRLLLMGNKKAEFMQTFKTGYRANGMRHPHSWSIVDAVECLQWMEGLFH